MTTDEHVEAVRRMQNYIWDHIREPITLLDLAKAAGYSPWHCARLFKTYTDKSPFDYIRALRLTEAAKVIRDEKHKVLDVALDFVFDSHEGFTRAFSKAFGITPKRYMNNPPPIRLFMPYLAAASYKSYMKGDHTMDQKTATVFTQVVEKPARKLLLRRGIKAKDYFAYCEEVGCDVWGILCSVREALGEPMGIWLSKELMKPGTSKYIQGVEVPLDYSSELPEGYEVIDLPAVRWMIFQGEPFEDEVFEEAIDEVRDSIKKYDPKIYGFEWQEDGLRFQLEPQGYRGYIEGREVK